MWCTVSCCMTTLNPPNPIRRKNFLTSTSYQVLVSTHLLCNCFVIQRICGGLFRHPAYEAFDSCLVYMIHSLWTTFIWTITIISQNVPKNFPWLSILTIKALALQSLSTSGELEQIKLPSSMHDHPPVQWLLGVIISTQWNCNAKQNPNVNVGHHMSEGKDSVLIKHLGLERLGWQMGDLPEEQSNR